MTLFHVASGASLTVGIGSGGPIATLRALQAAPDTVRCDAPLRFSSLRRFQRKRHEGRVTVGKVLSFRHDVNASFRCLSFLAVS